MRLSLAFAVVMIVAWGHDAHAAFSWWCEPLHAYYPQVPSCPVPWRQVDPYATPQQSQPRATTPSPETGTAPVPSAAAGQPTFPSPLTAARGDGLDQWCQGSITALNMAICTDNDLRVAAVQRLHAFDDAKARLTSDQQKTLAADQNGWAMSYAQSCGLHADVAPTLPLAPSVKECLAHAGQQRLAYLRSYGTPAASSQTTPAANPGSAASSAASPSTPGPGPSAVSSDTASAVQQVTEPPAQPAETLPMSAPPANSPSAPDAKPSTPAAATVSCTTASRASANPFGGDARIPALGTLQGKTMAASVLLAWATVCLWVLAVFRNTRRQTR